MQFDYLVDDHGASNSGYVLTGNGSIPPAELLAGHDLVVNHVLQASDAPLTILVEQDLSRLAAGSLIIEVSGDEAMAFGWARPTSFGEPGVGRRIIRTNVWAGRVGLWTSELGSPNSSAP